MAGVGGVTSGKTTEANRYEDDELRSLKGNEGRSTSAAMNQLGGHAGLTQKYTLRGDDKSERQIKAEHQNEKAIHGPGDVAKEIVSEGGLELAEHLAEHALEHVGDVGGRAAFGLLVLPVSLAKSQYDMLKEVAEDSKVGHERAHAMTRDTMHAVLLSNLNGLPTEFAQAELAKYPDSVKGSNLALKMNKALGNDGDHAAMALCQLHCDQGMNAARAMCDAGLAKETYLAAHPDVAKRCAEDPAFKAGFDGVAWAKQKGPDAYGAVIKDLEARDVRYEQAHVAWRA
jgi:hypothetical protein